MTNLLEHQLTEIAKGLKPDSLYEPIRYTLNLGGKRIRPALVFIGNGICGGDNSQAVHAAKAVEMLHNFTLIHDDIMDQADTRRGKPSVFRKWNTNTAILSGDALYTLALEELLSYGNNPEYSKEEFYALYKTFLHGTRVVCEGQAKDIEFELNNQVTIEDYLEMISEKTAALLSTSLVMGGITAHASQNELNRLSMIGYNAGIAFQIQDDHLDAFGDPEQTGKKLGGDIREGKKTWLILRARQKASESELDLLKKIENEGSLNESDVNAIINLLNELNIADESENLINKYYQESVRLINEFEDSPYKQKLLTLLNTLSTRNQ